MKETASRDTIGSRIRALRQSSGYTIRELSEQSGVNESTITMIELGHIKSPGAIYLRRIAEALSVTLDSLVPETE